MPFGADLTSAVTLWSSTADPVPDEEDVEYGEEGGGKGGAGGEGGGGQQSAEPQPASKQDCWQYPLTLIHFSFEQALSNNNSTPRTDRQSPHVSPPALLIDLGALSSHITHSEEGGGDGGGGLQQPALSLTSR